MQAHPQALQLKGCPTVGLILPQLDDRENSAELMDTKDHRLNVTCRAASVEFFVSCFGKLEFSPMDYE